MKIDKKKYTVHGYERIKERTDIKDKEMNNLGFLAIKNGINVGQIPEGKLKKYIEGKIAKQNKRIKLYRGCVFIFFINSRRIITCYPIPEEYVEEYNKLVKSKNKEKKKKMSKRT